MPASLTPWAPTDREPQEVEESPNGRYIRYNILLGKGACKRVYKALDTEEGLEVAWNQVDMLGMDRDEEARLHLQEEIRVLQQLKHKNIMTFYAWWYDKNNLHINFITELFTSGSLRQYRKKLKIMSENVLKRWAHQILEGLLYLHGHTPPIVHRDLKCDNIFVNSATGEVKIGDLGLATVQQTAMSVVGTPEFMAPEVYDESYDERCDIYSFGMCLLELATLEYPYAECHSVPQIFKKVTLGIPPASLARVSPELREFISLCIAHNPSDRPSSRELLKHPYLEAVRQAGSDSCSTLPSGGASSGGLTSLSNGGASNGWNTPSGTLHCAASVRDLRDALHHQEALARHHHQQHLQLYQQQQHQHYHQQQHQLLLQQHQQQQQVLHSSCPDVHAVATAAEAAADAAGATDARGSGSGGSSGDGDGGSHEILRRNTVALGVLARSSTANTSGAQMSPLGRSTKSPFTKTAAAAVAVAAAPAGPPQPPPPPLTTATAVSTAVSTAAAAARSTQSMSSSVGSGESDTDSDEEVIVPIELLKAGLLEEGFVDSDAAAAAAFASGPSDTGSAPSVLSLEDPALIPSVVLGQPGPTAAAAAPPAAAAETPGSLSHSSERQQQYPHPSFLQPPRPQQQSNVEDGEGGEQQQQRRRGRQRVAAPPPLPPRAPRSGGGMHKPAVGERGNGGTASSSIEGVVAAMGVAAAAAAAAEEAVEDEEEQKDVEAEKVEAEGVGGGDGKVVLDEGRQLGGDVAATAVDLDPLTQRWALRESFQAATGMAHDGGSGGDVEAAPSLACSVGSSASSTARRLSHGSGGSIGGRHSRQSSADAITFNPLQPSGGSGASTPALRVSYSGNGRPPPTSPLQLLQLPSLPPTAAVAPAMSPLVNCLTSSGCADSAAAVAAAAAPSPVLSMRGSVPSLSGTPAPGMVRLPSFRNRVLLTMQGTPGGGSCGGGSTPYGPYFRSTSARLETASLGGSSLSHPREVPSFICTALPNLQSMAAVGVVPGYSSLGGASTFRHVSSVDIDAAATAAAVAGVPLVAAAADIASVSMGAADTAGNEERRGDGEVEGMLACQPITPPRLAGVPECHSEGDDSGRPLQQQQPPTSVMANPPDGTAAPAAAMTALAAGRLSEFADPGMMEILSAISIFGCGGGAAAAAATGVRADCRGEALPTALAPAAPAPAPLPPPPAELAVGLLPHPPTPTALHPAELSVDMTVIKEMSRPIQGVIMRLKQWKRLMKDRAKGLRS